MTCEKVGRSRALSSSLAAAASSVTLRRSVATERTRASFVPARSLWKNSDEHGVHSTTSPVAWAAYPIGAHSSRLGISSSDTQQAERIALEHLLHLVHVEPRQRCSFKHVVHPAHGIDRCRGG